MRRRTSVWKVGSSKPDPVIVFLDEKLHLCLFTEGCHCDLLLGKGGAIVFIVKITTGPLSSCRTQLETTMDCKRTLSFYDP